MTGEVTLRGRVLPVGGIKEKLLAAHRGEVETVLIPAENEKDLPDLPETARKNLDIRLVETMDDVLTHTFENSIHTKKKSTRTTAAKKKSVTKRKPVRKTSPKRKTPKRT